MRTSLPKYRAERVRLQAHLETQRRLINGDVTEIKSALKPITIAKQVISEAADSFRDNSFATQTTRLALTLLPFRRHPLVGIAAQIAVPLLVRHVPTLLHMIREKRGQGEVGGSVASTRVEVIGGLRKAVASLRERIR